MTTRTITTSVGEIPSPSNWGSINQDMYQSIASTAEITRIEKQSGRTTVEDIKDALDEYDRLFKAGIASDAELLTLHRAFPNSPTYTKAVQKMGESEPVVVGGPASVELIDREGHMITTTALKKAFKKYMDNFRTRNTMVLHSDVQVGWALPAYITKGGQIFKSGVDDKGLFFVTEIRKDTKIANKVLEQINEGKLKSYSIAGSATKTKNMQKGLMPYMQVDEMELAEPTVCEKGVNQGASFDILKAEGAATKSCSDGSCLISKSEGCDCGCSNASLELLYKEDGNISFIDSLKNWMAKEEKDPLKSGKSFATLLNFAGRDAEHHQLLREYGFPSEQPQEGMRYSPVIETETDGQGLPIHIRPPWVVNESGQNLGNRHNEDAAGYYESLTAQAQKAAKDAGHPWYSPEIEVKKTKDFFTWMSKEHEDGKPHWCKEHNRMESGNHEKVEIDKSLEGGSGSPHLGWFEVKSTDTFLSWMSKQNDIEAVVANAMDQAYPDWRKDKKAYGDKWDKMKEKIQEGYRKFLKD